MQTLETNSFREATRCRRAQYSGRPVELSLNGSRFFGLVRSVQEDQSCSPQRWIVTIVPTVGKGSACWLAVLFAPREADVLDGLADDALRGYQGPRENLKSFGGTQFDAGNFCLFAAQRSPTKGRGRALRFIHRQAEGHLRRANFEPGGF